MVNKMKPATAHYLILSSFCLAFYSGCTSYKFLESEHHPRTWKKLFLVHHWPVTVCKMSENDCKDPPQYWTIHGLWPDKVDECNRTWHFNVTEIKDLLPDMRHYWPDILHSSPNRTQFWKHEWEKHGTCAATVEPLNSQKKYFGRTLDLYQKLDLNSCLLKVGIKPSSTYYQRSLAFKSSDDSHKRSPYKCLWSNTKGSVPSSRRDATLRSQPSLLSTAEKLQRLRKQL
ncbi:ribonuclease T2 isoform X2 [Caretta caretta]|uniref:ribonuclease T2 isoform X2 n=1 Tax=Caretta caretta TaxID=8467 RepID=UPI002094FAA7|nr:ribonuclease T2 isoform X2 [Caretta caretta]